MECGPIAAGLSFNGYSEVEVNGEKTKVARHDRVQSAIIWNLETSYTIKDFLASWNISAHDWLKYYIYLRMLPNDKNKRGGVNLGAAMTTFVVSAIWHGFYPGFMMFFVGAGLLDYVAKILTPLVKPLVEGWCPWPV